ncbi:MAG: flavodoxin family protein [Sedimentisphaerales bacterium]|nr:flavodoxin family protein [Sedimentisphaerales bacterium]
MNRRKFINKTLAAEAAVSIPSTTAIAGNRKPIRILGISCSPRKGKTTAIAVRAALDAAKKIDNSIEVELLDLGGLQIAGSLGGASSDEAKQPEDDFEIEVLPVLKAPKLPDGLIIGSPSYFRAMSALCKAFLERIQVLRSPKLLLADTPVGVLSVGAYRNGGQELVIEQIQAAMLCYEVMLVGGKPRAHQGATLWNAYNDDITKDEFGIATAKQLGIRVAEAALRLASKKT